MAGCSKVDPEKRRHDQYWDRRRALRIRPVGEGNEEVETRKYFEDHLNMSKSSLNTLGLGRLIFERVPYGQRSKYQKELIVWLPSVDARDLVKSAARNLAGKGPEFGVNHELPDFLKSAMSDLQRISFDIKKKHPEARRNVLFNDRLWILTWILPLRRAVNGTGSRPSKQRQGREHHRRPIDSWKTMSWTRS